MDREVISVRVEDDREDVPHESLKSEFFAIPVVDVLNGLVGIVTDDDAAEVLQEEATENRCRLAAVAEMEDGDLQTLLFERRWS